MIDVRSMEKTIALLFLLGFIARPAEIPFENDDEGFRFSSRESFAEFDTRYLTCGNFNSNLSYVIRPRHFKISFHAKFGTKKGIILSGITANSSINMKKGNPNDDLGFIIYIDSPRIILLIKSLYDDKELVRIEHFNSIYGDPWNNWHFIEMAVISRSNKIGKEVILTYDNREIKKRLYADFLPDLKLLDFPSRHELFLGLPPMYTMSRTMTFQIFQDSFKLNDFSHNQRPTFNDLSQEMSEDDPTIFEKVLFEPTFIGQIKALQITNECSCSNGSFGPNFIWHGEDFRWNKACDANALGVSHHETDFCYDKREESYQSLESCFCSPHLVEELMCSCPRNSFCPAISDQKSGIWKSLMNEQRVPEKLLEFGIKDPVQKSYPQEDFVFVRNSRNESKRVSIKLFNDFNSTGNGNYENLNCFSNLFNCRYGWIFSFWIRLEADLHVNQYGENVPIFMHQSNESSYYGLSMNYTTRMIDEYSAERPSQMIHLKYLSPDDKIWTIHEPVRFFPRVWHNIVIRFENNALLLTINGNYIKQTLPVKYKYDVNARLRYARDTSILFFGGYPKKHLPDTTILLKWIQFQELRTSQDQDGLVQKSIHCTASRKVSDNTLRFFYLNPNRMIDLNHSLSDREAVKLYNSQGLYYRMHLDKRLSMTTIGKVQLLKQSNLFVILTKHFAHEIMLTIIKRGGVKSYIIEKKDIQKTNQFDFYLSPNGRLDNAWWNNMPVMKIPPNNATDRELIITQTEWFQVSNSQTNQLFQTSSKALLCFANRETLIENEIISKNTSNVHRPIDIPQSLVASEDKEYRSLLPRGCFSQLDLCSQGFAVSFWTKVKSSLDNRSVMNTSWTAYDSFNPITQSGIRVQINLSKWRTKLATISFDIKASVPTSIGFRDDELVFRLNTWTITKNMPIIPEEDHWDQLRISWSRLWGLQFWLNNELMGETSDPSVSFRNGNIEVLNPDQYLHEHATTCSIGNFKTSDIARNRRQAMKLNGQNKGSFNLEDLKLFDYPSHEPSVLKMTNQGISIGKIASFYPWHNPRSIVLIPNEMNKYAALITKNSRVSGLCLPLDNFDDFGIYTIRMSVNLQSPNGIYPILHLPRSLRLVVNHKTLLIAPLFESPVPVLLPHEFAFNKSNLIEIEFNQNLVSVTINRIPFVNASLKAPLQAPSMDELAVIGGFCEEKVKRNLCADYFLLNWFEVWSGPLRLITKYGALTTGQNEVL